MNRMERELVEALGRPAVSSDPASRAVAAAGTQPAALLALKRGQLPPLPALVARPGDAAGVAAALAIAARAGVPVRIAGQGAGAALAGALALDLTRLDGLELDLTASVAAVGAGRGLARLETALHRLDRSLGCLPDLSPTSTVGALTAGGAWPEVALWGRPQPVQRLEAALPDGSLAVLPPALWPAPGGAGFALITRVWVAVAPPPEHHATAALAFPHGEAALAAVHRLWERRVAPDWLRLFDAPATEHSFDTTAPAGHWLLLLGSAGAARPAQVRLGQAVAEALPGGSELGEAAVRRFRQGATAPAALLHLLHQPGGWMGWVRLEAAWGALSEGWLAVRRVLRERCPVVLGTLARADAGGGRLLLRFAGRAATEAAAAEALADATVAALAAAQAAGGRAWAPGEPAPPEAGQAAVWRRIAAALDPAGVLRGGRQP